MSHTIQYCDNIFLRKIKNKQLDLAGEDTPTSLLPREVEKLSICMYGILRQGVLRDYTLAQLILPVHTY